MTGIRVPCAESRSGGGGSPGREMEAQNGFVQAF